jgi:peptidyl-prolyl cis-trans isomerase SurA
MTRLINLTGMIMLLSVATTFGQTNDDDATLLTIDNAKITKGEFVRIYKKNNTKDTQIDNKSLNDYLELFINFKLKVLEAEKLGLDTAESFKKELAGYRKQLAIPYLVDKDVDEKLLKEAYERKKIALRASHILIKLNDNATPQDTLVAYNKALDLYNKAKAGEDFGKLAKENSEDETTKNTLGDISYFSVLSTVYPFETAAYNLKINEISMPVRTAFGYHVIKLTEKITNPGEVKVAHIMVLVPKDAKPEDVKKAEEKINEVYTKLQAGGDFGKLAIEFSDDKSSAKKGGELPWFGTGRMVPEFESAAFGLKNQGEYSKPVRTAFGWHILKKVDSKPVGTYEEVKSDLQTKLTKDSRAQQSRISLIGRLKKEYNFKLNEKQLAEFYKVADTSLFSGNWKAEKAALLTKPLYTLGDSTYNQKQFANYLENTRKKTKVENANQAVLTMHINDQFNKFSEEKIIAYEEARLDNKYPQFRYLMNEYHDGILLFDLTDKMVWSKAVKDSIGLKEFYEKNKNSYMWEKRADVTIFQYANDKAKDETIKLIEKKVSKGYSNEDIVKMETKKDSSALIIIENKLYQKGDNTSIDKIAFNAENALNKTYDINAEKHQILYINKMIEPQVKSLPEAKGLATADYQAFLEKNWISELRSKHTITVNKEVLSTIK